MKAEYRIIIKNETDKNAKSPIAPTDQGGEKSASTTPKSGGDASASASATGGDGNALTKFVAYKKIVAPFVKNAVQFQIQTVALRTGNHELQSRLQASYNIGSQIVSFAESAIVGGLVTGNPIGAVMGAVMSVLNTAITLTQKFEVYNLQRNLENTSIALMNVRAGGNVATTSGRR